MTGPPPRPEPVRSDKEITVGGQTFPVVYREANRPGPVPPDLDLSQLGGLAATAHGFIAPFNQRVYDAAPDIVCEQDVAVTLRDGATIYCDIYRPKDSGPVPVIVSWSAYGKRPGDAMSQWVIPGVPPGTVSTMAKFESADPAYWCRNGYAVANVDPRGVGYSEGDIELFGPQDAQDGYDFVEWVASQPWCTGKVGMAGNSMVAMTQLRIAAQQPPHLAAIAPWEASSDMYRDLLLEGGIPALTFNEFIVASLSGHGLRRRPGRQRAALPADAPVLAVQDPRLHEDHGAGVRRRGVEPHPPARHDERLAADRLAGTSGCAATASTSGRSSTPGRASLT